MKFYMFCIFDFARSYGKVAGVAYIVKTGVVHADTAENAIQCVRLNPSFRPGHRVGVWPIAFELEQ